MISLFNDLLISNYQTGTTFPDKSGQVTKERDKLPRLVGISTSLNRLTCSFHFETSL